MLQKPSLLKSTWSSRDRGGTMARAPCSSSCSAGMPSAARGAGMDASACGNNSFTMQGGHITPLRFKALTLPSLVTNFSAMFTDLMNSRLQITFSPGER